MRTKKITYFAVLLALSLSLGYFENMMPGINGLAGGRIGLANIVTMLVFSLNGGVPALVFGILRSFISAVLYQGISSLIYSITGSVMSVLSMLIAKKLLKTRVSEVGLSITGASFFNIGQLLAFSLVLKSGEVLRYLPVYLVISAFAGLVTGFCAKKTITHISKIL